MKVFITGIGSDLGTHIAHMLESQRSVTAIAGIDRYPPRRYLARTEFFLARTYDHEEVSDVISSFSPDVVINFGVYEPGARLKLSQAQRATQTSTRGIIHGIERSKNKQAHVITRSSVVVYGFSEPKMKDETSPLSPDTPYALMCRDLEEDFREGVSRLTIIRTAPELGAHVPHPLARILNLPALPVEVRNPFSREVGFPVISPYDATDIFVKASQEVLQDNEVNIYNAATSSNATISMAIMYGKRVPFLAVGALYPFLKQAAYVQGVPVDEHVEMLIRRGMQVDSTSTRMKLGITSQLSAVEVIKNLYSASGVEYETLSPREAEL